MTHRSAFIKPILATTAALAGAGGVASFVALRATPTIKSHCRVHGVDVGGLTEEEAAKKLRVWWETTRRDPLELKWSTSPDPSKSLGSRTPTQLGVLLDDVATVAELPKNAATDSIKAFFHAAPADGEDFQAKFKAVPVDLAPLKSEISKIAGPPHPAKVGWDGKEIIRKPESVRFNLAVEKLPEVVGEAINTDSPSIELPIEASEKHVKDEDLNKITELVSSYTTHFPAYQSNRNNNIKVAASKLSGVVLLPGEKLSFNETVGERTVNAGFQEAGIYKNGKHDKGIGGGICQVSSTLYNASLFGNLKIVRHHNHSMPVAYVPIGRDATVNYGVIDLVIENPYPTPIAVTSEYKPGALTFRIFGIADPSLSIKVEQTGQEDWDQPVVYKTDPHLKVGQQVIVEKGSRGHKVLVYRLVYKNGVLEKKEPLGRSYYSASTRIIARGPAPLGGYPPSKPTPKPPSD